jgi:iron(III) transport system substrate-binding protein
MGAGEGPVDWLASAEVDDVAEKVELFHEQFPEVEVSHQQINQQGAVQQIVTVAAAGRPPEHDASSGGFANYVDVFDRELVASIDRETWLALGVPEEFIFDYGGGIFVPRLERNVLGLGYNTELVDEAELPNTWEELVDPKWDGRIVVDPRGSGFETFALEWGQEETIDYFTRLVETTNPLPIEGQTDGMARVASGEALLGTYAFNDVVAFFQSEGSPVDIKYLDLVVTNDNYAFPATDAADPNATLCWIAWLTSPEGIAATQAIEFKGNESRPEGIPEDSVLTTGGSTPEEFELVNETGEALAAIIAGG